MWAQMIILDCLAGYYAAANLNFVEEFMPKGHIIDIDPAWTTVGEAAKYLGVGRKVVYQLIEYGRLRAVRDRSVVLVEKNSLAEFRGSGQLS